MTAGAAALSASSGFVAHLDWSIVSNSERRLYNDVAIATRDTIYGCCVFELRRRLGWFSGAGVLAGVETWEGPSFRTAPHLLHPRD